MDNFRSDNAAIVGGHRCESGWKSNEFRIPVGADKRPSKYVVPQKS